MRIQELYSIPLLREFLWAVLPELELLEWLVEVCFYALRPAPEVRHAFLFSRSASASEARQWRGLRLV